MDDITLSKKYLHDLKKLNIDHEEGQITDEEFSQRIDELREREARSKEALGHMLLLRKLEEAERDIEDEVKRESRRKLQELKVENMIKQKEEYLQRRKKEKKKGMNTDVEQTGILVISRIMHKNGNFGIPGSRSSF